MCVKILNDIYFETEVVLFIFSGLC